MASDLAARLIKHTARRKAKTTRKPGRKRTPRYLRGSLLAGQAQLR